MSKLKRLLGIFFILIGIIVTMTSGLPIAENAAVAEAATVKINKKNAAMAENDVLQLEITGTEKKVTWKSSNKKVALVNQYGRVLARKSGKATITATVNKKKYKCKIVVNPIKINTEKVTLAVGNTYQLSVNTNRNVSWLIKDPEIASITSEGLVTAKKAGNTSVIASVGKQKCVCSLIVTSNSTSNNNTETGQPTKQLYINAETYYVNIAEGESTQIIVTSNCENLYQTSANASAATAFLKVNNGIYYTMIINGISEGKTIIKIADSNGNPTIVKNVTVNVYLKRMATHKQEKIKIM